MEQIVGSTTSKGAISPAASSRRRGVVSVTYAELLLVALLWGGTWPVNKLAVQDASALTVAGLRYFLTTVILLAMLPTAGRGKARQAVRDWPLWLVSGIAGPFATGALGTVALKFAPASDGAMILPAASPVLTAVLAAAFLREKVTQWHMLGLALAAVGEILVFEGAIFGNEASARRLLGDFLLLAGAVAWSSYSVLNRVAARRHSAVTGTVYSSVVGTVLLLAVAAPHLQRDVSQTQLPFIMQIGYLGPLATAGGLLLYYRAVRHIGAGRTAMFAMPLIPVFSVIISIIFLDERPQAIQFIGMFLVLTAVWLANRGEAAALPE